jgi:hypothetical protein
MRLKKSSMYELGIMTKNSLVPNDIRWTKTPIVFRGEDLTVTSVKDFWNSNPLGKEPQKLYTLLEIKSDGSKEFVGTGIFSFKRDGQLSDQIPMYQPPQESKVGMEAMKEQLDRMFSILDAKEELVISLQNSLMEANARAIQLQAEIDSMKHQQKYEEESIAYMNKMTKKDDGIGLNDIMTLITALPGLVGLAKGHSSPSSDSVPQESLNDSEFVSSLPEPNYEFN